MAQKHGPACDFPGCKQAANEQHTLRLVIEAGQRRIVDALHFCSDLHRSASKRAIDLFGGRTRG